MKFRKKHDLMRYAQVGQPAPSFALPAARAGETAAMPVTKVSLFDHAGRWLVLVWYPGDFTFVCPTELTALSDRYEEFQEQDCDVLALSTDSVYSHRAWLGTPRETNGVADVRFPLLSDPTHRIARAYGVLDEKSGIARRGLFVVDPDGVLQHATINNLNVGRSVAETLRVLFALQSGGLCPSDWKPGQSTL